MMDVSSFASVSVVQCAMPEVNGAESTSSWCMLLEHNGFLHAAREHAHHHGLSRLPLESRLLHLLPLVPIIANHCCARLKMSRDRDEYHLVLFFAGY
jgi:hypothetical protein